VVRRIPSPPQHGPLKQRRDPMRRQHVTTRWTGGSRTIC
jgi:hypothetical protein